MNPYQLSGLKSCEEIQSLYMMNRFNLGFYFVLLRLTKGLWVWNNVRVSKWWQNFYFWENYPFNG